MLTEPLIGMLMLPESAVLEAALSVKLGGETAFTESFVPADPVVRVPCDNVVGEGVTVSNSPTCSLLGPVAASI